MDVNVILTQVLSSAIVGFITWLGGLLVQQLKNRKAAITDITTRIAHENGLPAASFLSPVDGMNQPGSAAPLIWPAPRTSTRAPSAPNTPRRSSPAVSGVNFRVAALQVAGLQFGANVIGLLVAVAVYLVVGKAPVAQTLFIAIQLPLGTVFLTAGFFVIGLLTERGVRARHMLYVALGTAAATVLVNTALGAGARSIAGLAASLMVALCQSLLAMVIGGVAAGLITKDVTLQPRRAPLMVKTGYPYATANGPAGRAGAYGHGYSFGVGPRAAFPQPGAPGVAPAQSLMPRAPQPPRAPWAQPPSLPGASAVPYSGTQQGAAQSSFRPW